MDSSSQTKQGNITAPAPDGSRFVLAAPENIRLPTDGTPLLRALDSFVFITHGKPTPLPDGWINNQDWAGIEIVGATASLTGPGSTLAQCGWITQLTWRWVRLTQILRGAMFLVDNPFGRSVSQLDRSSSPPLFRRAAHTDPRPSWWDHSWGEAWPPSASESLAGVKRTAPLTAGSNDSSHDAEACTNQDGFERRVRRRASKDGLDHATANESSRDGNPLATGQPSSMRSERRRANSVDDARPRLGVKMSRCWDISRDHIAGPSANNSSQLR
ncbi:hypothetical protein RHS02_06340, partial [Rhizoctonia solani]